MAAGVSDIFCEVPVDDSGLEELLFEDNPSLIEAFKKIPTTAEEFLEAISNYQEISTSGLEAVFNDYPDCQETFFSSTLPFIVDRALALPSLCPKLPILKQGVRADVTISRNVCVSLLANMFLCAFRALPSEAFPCTHFGELFGDGKFPQEQAKLRMFIHYFERVRQETPVGSVRICRLQSHKDADSWGHSKKPLLKIEVMPKGEGFEGAHGLGCLHADFANKYIGGGVLTGGCVQEEIRFSICPELSVAMLLCPCMLPNEAIQIAGGEQYSRYQGYGYSLRYGGDHRDTTPRADDGSVMNAITAIDALDGRGEKFGIHSQLQTPKLLRELNKATAGFEAYDGDSARWWPIVATGNWGCGAFEGNVEVKAIIQWLAASEGGREVRYFPFNHDFGPKLQNVVARLISRRTTVGELYRGLLAARDDLAPHMSLLELVANEVERAHMPCCAGLRGPTSLDAMG